MTLIEKIKIAFMDAYKAKDMDLKNAIGTIKGEIERSAKDPKNITDDEVTSKLKSMLKVHNESISGDNPVPVLSIDELNFINGLLPKQMTEAEIDAKIKELVDGGANHIGKFMGGFKGLEADMKMVKEKVETILN